MKAIKGKSTNERCSSELSKFDCVQIQLPSSSAAMFAFFVRPQNNNVTYLPIGPPKLEC